MKNSSGGDNFCFLNHLTQLCNSLISGKAGDPDWWLNTQLVCIPKPNGSIRHIGIQNVFIRLASSSVANIVSLDVVEKLKEQNQFGIGIKGGCEIVAHYVIACAKKIDLIYHKARS